MNNAPISPVILAQGGNQSGAQTALSAGLKIDGLVTAFDRDGHALVRTPQGVFALLANPTLAVGTRVTLEIVLLGNTLGARIIAFATPGQSMAALRPLGITEAIVPPLANAGVVAPAPIGFPALAEALAKLHVQAPGLAAQASQALPGGGGPFVATLLATIGALRRSDVAALLGADGARSLDRATHHALKRELEGAQHDATLDSDEPWHGLLIPVLDGGSLGQLTLFVRRHAPETDETDGHNPVRFVIEANPSTVGPLQIDGLSFERRLDLIVRSHRPLPPDWRDDIRALYAAALAELKLSGSIVYQVVPRFPINGTAALRASGHPTLTV